MNTDLNFHSYKQHANSIREWDYFDTLERFEENKRKNYDLLEKNKWLEKKITYSYNSHGFRSEEFESNNDSILFMGCSLTFGTGLPLEETYNYKIANKLKMKFFSVALGGSSNDTAFRFGYYYIPKLKPKLVVLASPEVTRLELCDNGKILQYRSQMKIYQMDSFYKKWVLDDTNSSLNQQKNILALENICLKNNVKFVHFNAPEMFLVDSVIKDDYARDLVHPGSMTHQIVSEKLLNKI